MSTFPTNILQQVQTYNRAGLGLMQNLSCHIDTANKKFKDFDKLTANLGSSVAFDTPPRATVNQGLVASWQGVEQLIETLTVDQANNASYTVTSEQRIFNLEKGEEDYMRVFGKSFVAELAGDVEANIAQNWDSSVRAQAGENKGNLNTLSGPFRYFGNGSTPLTSYQQLARAITLFRNFGSVATGTKVYLPDLVVPDVVGNGLNQFAPRRNDDIAMSWQIGSFGTPPVEYYHSNLMPMHVSGNVGVNQSTLTVISTNDPTGQRVTQITCSGAAVSDASAVFSGDVGSFNDGVANQPNMRYLTYIAHRVSSNKVQFRVTADAASDGSGNVVLNIYPALNWAGGANQNLNNAIAAGMQITMEGSHRCGGILGDDAFYLAMPKLPEQRPYDSASEFDPDTGASLRLTYGSVLGQNQTGLVYDEVHGSHIVPIYSMRYLIPLSQA